jgi:RNA polymerase II subunit A C-terminal domain phosphatase SSU72
MALLVVSLFDRSLILQCVDLHNRDHVLLKTVLIINLEVKDNHEEATIGARLTLDLCQEVCFLRSFEN